MFDYIPRNRDGFAVCTYAAAGIGQVRRRAARGGGRSSEPPRHSHARTPLAPRLLDAHSSSSGVPGTESGPFFCGVVISGPPTWKGGGEAAAICSRIHSGCTSR